MPVYCRAVTAGAVHNALNESHSLIKRASEILDRDTAPSARDKLVDEVTTLSYLGDLRPVIVECVADLEQLVVKL